ncbi:MAG: alpha/beta hydrolase [Candidatus Margulisiibacteriota bacterium]
MADIKLGNMKMYYEVCGKGEPLLLIAGLASDSSSWGGVIKDLSSNFTTVIFDNRGSGRSSKPEEPYTIEDMAVDCIKLLDTLKIEKCHVLGHSMGGYIGQVLAAQYPERVDRLILEDTSFVSSKRNNELYKGFLNELEKGSSSEAIVRGWVPWLFSPKTVSGTSFIESFVKAASEYPYLQTAKGFAGQIGAIASFAGKNAAASIKSNTLVLAGAQDALITPQEAEALARLILGSRFSVLDGAGHALHIERPKEFVREVTGFILGSVATSPKTP